MKEGLKIVGAIVGLVALGLFLAKANFPGAVGFAIWIAYGLFIGFLAGYLLFRVNEKSPGEINAILKNPRRLAQELQKHGKIYDRDKNDHKEELIIDVKQDESGKEQISIETRPVPEKRKAPPPVETPREDHVGPSPQEKPKKKKKKKSPRRILDRI